MIHLTNFTNPAEEAALACFWNAPGETWGWRKQVSSNPLTDEVSNTEYDYNICEDVGYMRREVIGQLLKLTFLSIKIGSCKIFSDCDDASFE